MRYLRKILRIKAEDSPNVRLGMEQLRRGLPVTHDEIVPGVLPYREYLKRRKTWDKVRQCIGLDAEFWEGADVLMFPPDWLNLAEQTADKHKDRSRRQARGIGVDPGEGIADTSIAVVDEYGIIELWSEPTRDTSVITGLVAARIREYNCPHDHVVFDRGGGGQQHADRMRDQGYAVRSVGFGESVTLDPKRGLVLFEEKVANKENRYAYRNRRAEMYWDLRSLINPDNRTSFGLDRRFTELRRQLSVIPIWYDEEGRIMLPPKQRKSGEKDTGKKVTLNTILGCSPDQADALVLAVHGMLHQPIVPSAGLL